MSEFEAAPEMDAPEEVSNDEVIEEVSEEISEDAPTEELNEEELEEVKEEVKSTLKKLNIKVDGKEIEREIDLANEEELIKMVQMAEMANKRAQEAADLRKQDMNRNSQLEKFINELKTNPGSVLKHMGVNVNDFAEKVLDNEVKKMQMTDEERELMELKEELAKIKERETKSKEEAKVRKAEALRNRYANDMEKNLLASIEEHNLPNSPHIINQMVNMVATAHKNKIDLSFSDVAPLVKAEHEADIRNRISGLSADDLIKLLSEDKLTNLVAKRLPKKTKKAPPTTDNIKETGTKKEVEGAAKFRTKSLNDFFNNKRFGK